MVDNAESLRPQMEHLNEVDGPVFKIADDPRCTPLGRGLRRTSTDELPQLWNILRGDMSFVGPRPPMPEEVEKYESWQRRRLRMRPGMTCLWALEGRSRLNFDRWMQLDLSYIDRWSLWLDAKIFVKTISARSVRPRSMVEPAQPGLVSILIVTFNSAKTLVACLDSIQQQDYSPLEIIFVDN